MALSASQKKRITETLENWISTKVQEYSRETTYMPFFSKIMQNESIVKMYSFSISIATSLGQSIYEQIGSIAASESSDISTRSWKSELKVDKNRKNKIEEIVDELRNGTRRVNKQNEIKEILSIPNKDLVSVKDGRTVDLYIKKGKTEYYCEIKTVKPNIDTFTKTKHKLLTWVARANKPINSFLVFPYNPYYPEKYERFSQSGVIGTDEMLIGEQFWDFLGGKGTYDEVLSIFDQVGKKYAPEIKKMLQF